MNEIRFKILPHQEGFFNSCARFPAFIAAWGTGKTTLLILKGLYLSEKYHGNLGMIFRKTEKSLRKSTVRDFQDYTKLKVPQTTNEIEIPGTGSRIMFGHADDMRSLQDMLQNVNLGWVGIEQAEELTSPAVFDILRGRLRRVLTPSVEIQEKLVEIGALKKVVDDFRQLDNTRPAKELDRAIDALVNILHEPYHQLMPIANAQGHNWLWKRWKKAKWPEYELYEANSFANEANLPKTTLDDWRRLKYENPKKFNRMVMNSHEDYDIEGSYYAALMSDALKEGRVELTTLYDQTAPVYTFWDLGIRASDTTVIWFVQFIGHDIWLIDYHEDYGKGMDYYSHILDTKKYSYRGHFLPPDAAQRLQGAYIETRRDILRRLRGEGETIHVVSRHLVIERIEAARSVLSRCKFSDKCEKGVEAVNNYRKKRNEAASSDDAAVFLPEPLHDEYSNGADAFGLIGVVFRYEPVDGQILGYTGADPECYKEDEPAGEYDLLKVG